MIEIMSYSRQKVTCNIIVYIYFALVPSAFR